MFKIIFLLLLIFMISTCMANEKSKLPICATPGMFAGGSTINSLRCCQGYTLTNTWQFENYKKMGCETPTPPGSGGSCVKCGDKICDTKNFENHCVCPSDCPK